LLPWPLGSKDTRCSRLLSCRRSSAFCHRSRKLLLVNSQTQGSRPALCSVAPDGASETERRKPALTHPNGRGFCLVASRGSGGIALLSGLRTSGQDQRRVPRLRRFGSAVLFGKVIMRVQFRRRRPTGKSTAERQPLSRGTQPKILPRIPGHPHAKPWAWHPAQRDWSRAPPGATESRMSHRFCRPSRGSNCF
jgi:hypothetical protein